MRVPFTYKTRFSVHEEEDGVIVLTVRRPFGFAVEFVLEDSPLMVNRFLEAFKEGTKSVRIVEADYFTKPTKRLRKQLQQKADDPKKPSIPVAHGYQRPKTRGKTNDNK